jgi:hypothetical protein
MTPFSQRYKLHTQPHDKEVTGIAVKMKRIEGKNITLETSSQRAKDTYTDVGHGNDSADWIAPVVATALKHDIITTARKTFEGDRDVTRAEAYAMIMKSVCMNVTQNTSSDWRKTSMLSHKNKDSPSSHGTISLRTDLSSVKNSLSSPLEQQTGQSVQEDVIQSRCIVFLK